MRRDFAKLVFERPKSNRTWASKTPRPLAVRLDTDGELARDQNYRRKRQKLDGGRFTAAERFLVRQVGRPWNAVYAEVCALADARSFTGGYLRSAIESCVDVDCWMDSRVIRSKPNGDPVSGLYVDPRNGILKRAPDPPRRRGKRL